LQTNSWVFPALFVATLITVIFPILLWFRQHGADRVPILSEVFQSSPKFAIHSADRSSPGLCRPDRRLRPSSKYHEPSTAHALSLILHPRFLLFRGHA